MKSSFNPILVLASTIKLGKIFKAQGVEIVHAGQLREQSLSVLAKLLGSRVRVIRTYHRLTQFNWKTRILTSIYNSLTDSFIAVSEEMKNEMAKRGLKNVTVIYNGVPQVGSNRHEKAIGFLGRVAKEKGILEFIKANKKILTETQLVIAGDGQDFEAVKEFSEAEKLKVELLGQVKSLEEYFSKILVQVLPTAGESTVPLSILEGLSAGVPSITFDLPSIRNKIGEDCGVLFVENGDFAEMGKKAVDILGDEKELQKLRKEATKAYEANFSVEKMWQQTETLYKKLLS